MGHHKIVHQWRMNQGTNRYMLWSAISKIIPWAKVNSICHMSIFIHVASENVCAMPKSIYNMGN